MLRFEIYRFARRKGSNEHQNHGFRWRVEERVNEHDYKSLFSALNEAVEVLHRNRMPDPPFIAAFDTLKQSRARLVKVLNQAPQPLAELEAA